MKTTDKPAIFLDFDGLKFDTIHAHAKYLDKRYSNGNLNIATMGHSEWDTLKDAILKEYPSMTLDDIYCDLADHFLSSHEWHADITPYEGMIETLPLLAQQYELWTVTARQKASMEVIARLLDRHVPECISGIHCVWNRVDGNRFEPIHKHDFVSAFPGAKVAFIDDTPREVLAMDDVITSILFDPHHRHDADSRIKYRVHSWHEIGKMFLS